MREAPALASRAPGPGRRNQGTRVLAGARVAAAS